MHRRTHLRGWFGGVRVAIESAAPEGGQSVLNKQQETAGVCKAEAGPARTAEPPTTCHHLPPLATTAPELFLFKTSQIPIRTPLLLLYRPTSSNMTWEIAKIAPKTSQMSQKWPTRATKMASKTPNLGLQTSQMASRTCKKHRKNTIRHALTHDASDFDTYKSPLPQIKNQDRPQDRKNSPKMGTRSPQDCFQDPKLKPPDRHNS